MEAFEDRSERPRLETLVAAELGELLKGMAVGAEITEERARDLLGTLEYYLPALLELDFPEWREESLDGFYFAKAEKTGSHSARFLGTCILITDQTMTPFFLELALTAPGDDLASIKLFLGEDGGGKLGISGPDWGTKAALELLMNLPHRVDSIQWAYVIDTDSEDLTHWNQRFSAPFQFPSSSVGIGRRAASRALTSASAPCSLGL